MALCKALTKSGKPCKSPVATSFNVGLCLAHIRQLEPELLNEKKKSDKENKMDLNKTKKRNARANRDRILSIEHFDLKNEIELVQENSSVAGAFSNDPMDVGSVLQRQKVFAKWLNADDLTRIPQNIEDVALLLKVTVRRLKFWSQGVTVKKFMADMMDNAMKYDARKIALEGFLGLLQEKDPKAVDRYMQLYMSPKKSSGDEKDEDIKEWKLDTIAELPDDAPTDRRDKFIRDTHAEEALKIVSEE